MGQQAEQLSRRLAEFALGVLRLVRHLPRDVATDGVIRQVARSAGSMSANYRAACHARSRQEFVSKLAVAVEEADETTHWLWMAGQLGLAPGPEFDRLVAEAGEVTAILSTSLSTSRRNLQRSLTEPRRRPPKPRSSTD